LSCTRLDHEDFRMAGYFKSSSGWPAGIFFKNTAHGFMGGVGTPHDVADAMAKGFSLFKSKMEEKTHDKVSVGRFLEVARAFAEQGDSNIEICISRKCSVLKINEKYPVKVRIRMSMGKAEIHERVVPTKQFIITTVKKSWRNLPLEMVKNSEELKAFLKICENMRLEGKDMEAVFGGMMEKMQPKEDASLITLLTNALQTENACLIICLASEGQEKCETLGKSESASTLLRLKFHAELVTGIKHE